MENVPPNTFIENSFVTTPADDPNKQKLGWVIYEEVGMVIINDYAISKIDLTQPFRWVHVETPELPKYWPDPIWETGRMFDME